jgi:hypothetical protein
MAGRYVSRWHNLVAGTRIGNDWAGRNCISRFIVSQRDLIFLKSTKVMLLDSTKRRSTLTHFFLATT